MPNRHNWGLDYIPQRGKQAPGDGKIQAGAWRDSRNRWLDGNARAISGVMLHHLGDWAKGASLTMPDNVAAGSTHKVTQTGEYVARHTLTSLNVNTAQMANERLRRDETATFGMLRKRTSMHRAPSGNIIWLFHH